MVFYGSLILQDYRSPTNFDWPSVVCCCALSESPCWWSIRDPGEKKVRQWGVTPRKSLHHIEPQILNIYLLTSNLWQYVSDLTQIATSFIFPIAPGIQAHSNHCDPGQALLSNASASMILATVSWQGNWFGTCQGAILGLVVSRSLCLILIDIMY